LISSPPAVGIETSKKLYILLLYQINIGFEKTNCISTRNNGSYSLTTICTELIHLFVAMSIGIIY
jgi:hypothetical protein